MLANEVLLEHVITLKTPEEKSHYADVVWDILQKSYQDIGGFKSASSKEELVSTPGMWKLVRRDGEITAATVYKDSFGRKILGSGTNLTPQGKKDFRLIKAEDVKMKRAWAEVSGAPERIFQMLGAKPIPNKFASFLTGKEVLSFNNDGYRYTRLIAGNPMEKIIYGFVNLTDADVEALEAAGLSIHDISSNIA